MRKKKPPEAVRTVRRYTVGLENDLHDWLEKQAGGTSIAGTMVVILNQVRLGMWPNPMKVEEVKTMRQLTQEEIAKLRKLPDINPSDALAYLRDKNSVDFEVWDCKKVPKDFYEKLLV